ncbi:MAG: beta-N-acetylhexosaminidase [Gammaproteobacteria bacterium]|nr:beta-N-acetylhexosaminidase [Gammaproteobacteria bacterium]
MKLGPVMFDLAGTSLSPEEVELIQHPAAGGIILFTRNYRTPLQLRKLVQDIRQHRPDILIAVDQEGGRVQRFRHQFTPLPAARKFGQVYLDNPQLAKIYAETAAWVMAAELRQYDIDFSFAPVLDVDFKHNEVIGDRAFHSDVDIITEMGRSFVHGMNRAGMQAVGKHYPGHGYVGADSHLELPYDERTLRQLKAKDLIPFQRLIQAGLLAGIMPAHIVYPKIDKEAAGFSSYWLHTMLRKTLGFQGVIFSDSLTMAGAECAGGFDERAKKAWEAGCDMLLVCNNRLATYTMLDAMHSFSREGLHERLLALRGRGGEGVMALSADPVWEEAVELLKRMN